MGLLDGLFHDGGQEGQRPGFGGTLAAGAAIALLVKLLRHHQSDPNAQSAGATPAEGGGLGGLLGSLGGLGGFGAGGGGGLGGLLSSLGGAGAFGALVNRFQEKGFGQQVNSWVGKGQNQPIAPHEVGNVLGDDTLNELQARTGLSREELLQELSHELPHAIDAATPQGRLPQEHELQQMATSASTGSDGAPRPV